MDTTRIWSLQAEHRFLLDNRRRLLSPSLPCMCLAGKLCRGLRRDLSAHDCTCSLSEADSPPLKMNAVSKLHKCHWLMPIDPSICLQRMPCTLYHLQSPACSNPSHMPRMPCYLDLYTPCHKSNFPPPCFPPRKRFCWGIGGTYCESQVLVDRRKILQGKDRGSDFPCRSVQDRIQHS